MCHRVVLIAANCSPAARLCHPAGIREVHCEDPKCDGANVVAVKFRHTCDKCRQVRSSLGQGSTIRDIKLTDIVIDSDKSLKMWWDSLWRHYCLCRLGLPCWLASSRQMPKVELTEDLGRQYWRLAHKAPKPEWEEFLVIQHDNDGSSSSSGSKRSGSSSRSTSSYTSIRSSGADSGSTSRSSSSSRSRYKWKGVDRIAIYNQARSATLLKDLRAGIAEGA